MPDLNTLARDAMLLGVAGTVRKSNGANLRTGLQKQLFRDDTILYTAEVGALASNVYETSAQGINFDDWYSFVPIKIRVDNAVQVSSGELMSDDWMKIYIIQPTGIDTIGQGAYMYFDSNWWMVYKPKGVYSVRGTALIRRCNTVINKLDYYGGIVSVPMVFTKLGTLGNAPSVSENMILSKNYMNCFCQLNDITREFTENTRMIQGKAAYAIRGINDFTREYTDDPTSVHIMAFTMERQEPLEQDNIELQVADYYSFKWNISVQMSPGMIVGNMQTIAVSSYRNEVLVESTEKHPISYTIESPDEQVIRINPNGEIEAVGPGYATITVTLDQNPNIKLVTGISVASGGFNTVSFTSTPIDVLNEQDSCIISAAYIENGVETAEEVAFAFSGAPEKAYKATDLGNNTYQIQCFNASREPLVVTIEAHGTSQQMQIRLYP